VSEGGRRAGPRDGGTDAGTDADTDAGADARRAADSASPERTPGIIPVDFRARLSASPSAVLLLDYDGTLAPFRVERDEARPWPGVVAALERVRAEGRTRIVVITGREVAVVERLLAPFDPDDIWGVHGLERRRAGDLERSPLPPDCATGLAGAREACLDAGLGGLIEEKHGALALHWRGLPPVRGVQIRGWAEQLLEPLARRHGLEFRPFDGGIELRAAGPDKGAAVRLALSPVPDGQVAAFLGDDRTDEDAFQSLKELMGERGLAALVRAQPRESAADLRLEPPGELLRFLDAWAAARGRTT